MKKLTKEEVAQHGIIKNGRTTKIRIMLMELQIGEGFIIERGIDWKAKTPPYRIVNYFAKKSKRSFVSGQTADKKGWIVKRTA
jgi:hypothetical protein